MSKKSLILLIVAAGGSFGLSLGGTMVWNKMHPPGPKAKAQASTTAPVQEIVHLTPVERQLEDFIKEIRHKMEECKARQQELDEQEKRIALSRDLLKKQAQDLENLRVQLTAPMAALKDEQDKLEKTRIKIATEEKANLKRTASIYEKMDPASGSKILETLYTTSKTDDAVKILYYMSERAAGKILAEISDKTMASKMCEQLKRIREDG